LRISLFMKSRRPNNKICKLSSRSVGARADYLCENVSLPWPGAAIYTVVGRTGGRVYVHTRRESLLSWPQLTQSVFGRVFAFAHTHINLQGAARAAAAAATGGVARH